MGSCPRTPSTQTSEGEGEQAPWAPPALTQSGASTVSSQAPTEQALEGL